MSYPYSYFGFNLWRLREARGKAAQETAAYLNIGSSEYSRIEMGEVLPTDQILLGLSRFLKKEISVLKQWAVFACRREVEGPTVQGALTYTKNYEQALAKLEEGYKELTGKSLNEAQLKALKKLQRKIARTMELPVLPMNFILIADVILSNEVTKKYEYLHEISDFIIEGESFPQFISRDLYFGTKISSLANRLYFYEKPYISIEECMHQLTITQFKELFLLSVHNKRIYEIEDDIPLLQKHIDFTTMVCLFIRFLEKELQNDPPKNINFKHLYQACLLQGIGQYVLFDQLKPALIGTGEDLFDDEESQEMDMFPGMGRKLFSQINWELHPVISAMMGANLDMPKEVSEIVLTHHEDPKSVSAVCALLKFANFFVDADFPTFSKQEFEEHLTVYPSIKIPVEPFYEVCCKLSKLKPKLYERSSSLIEEASPQVTEFMSNRVKQAAQRNKIGNMALDDYRDMPLTRSDFRFDRGYQIFLKNLANTRYQNLFSNFFSPKRGEPILNLGERTVNFHLRLKYSLSKDLRYVAEETKLSVDEIKIRLGLK